MVLGTVLFLSYVSTTVVINDMGSVVKEIEDIEVAKISKDLSDIANNRPTPFLGLGVLSAIDHLLEANCDVTRALNILRQALMNKDSSSQWVAIRGLARFGSRAEPALTDVMKMIRAPDRLVREEAASALSCISKTKQVVLVLINALDDNEPTVRRAAALSLGALGKDAKRAVPALSNQLLALDVSCQVCVARALWKINGKFQEVFPVLFGALNGDDREAKRFAVWGFVEMGPKAHSATPVIAELLNDPDSSMRSAAAIALGNIGPKAKAALSTLEERARNENDLSVRISIGFAISKIKSLDRK